MQERQLASQAMERILELCVWLSERDAYDLLTLIQAEIQQVKSYYQPEIKTHRGIESGYIATCRRPTGKSGV